MGINFNSYFSNLYSGNSGSFVFNEFNPEPIDISVEFAKNSAVSPNLESTIEQVLHFMERLEIELNKRYPNGCKLVGVGRSPSLLIELFKAKGYDAQSCAISGLSNCEYDITGHSFYMNKLLPEDIEMYSKYLGEKGITADKVNSSTKPVVFIDYTRTGETLKKFAQLLARPEIGIKRNVEFLSINRDLLPSLTTLEHKMILELWENCGLKEFSFVPRLDISQLRNTDQITKDFKPSKEALEFLSQTKKVMFAIK